MALGLEQVAVLEHSAASRVVDAVGARHLLEARLKPEVPSLANFNSHFLRLQVNCNSTAVPSQSIFRSGALFKNQFVAGDLANSLVSKFGP